MRIRAALLAAAACLTLAQPAEARQRGGVASWYGPGFQGRLMANGQRYDQRSNTVAHRRLPLGTRLVLANPGNGRRTTAVVRDRGPYIHGREWDVSRGVAQSLGFIRQGTAPLTYRVIYRPAKPVTFHSKRRPA